MNFFKRRRILRSCNSLDLVPVRVCGHDEVEGNVVLYTPKFQGVITNTLFPITRMMFFKIKLDEKGSMVWKNIDGKSNVNEISEKVRELFERKNDIPGFHERTSRFMSMLYERRYITFRQLLDD